MAVFKNIIETIGETPIVRLNKLPVKGAKVYVKIERGNPGGSIKDRAVLSMIDDAEARGVLKTNGTIVEPTSGNTGIAIAMIAAVRGYKAIIVMPDTMSLERRQAIRAYGAEIVLTPGAEGMGGAVKKAEEIAKETGGWICGQFDNPLNAVAHRVGTGKEILRDLPDVDYVFAGFGTAGTVCGLAMAFKDAGSKAKVIGVEPAESPLVSEGKAGPHKIQGIGANFVPKIFEKDLLADVFTVKGDDAIATTVRMAREEGIFCGISSGAAVYAALERAKQEPDKVILAILPDGGEKYMSTGIFD
ncbi:MAG: cysteine synthase A [Candidatus Methanomethylophilaceae archaeon]|nr:cysteine synthase A [Candidatus Methanomethylophilaceae archaeon]